MSMTRRNDSTMHSKLVWTVAGQRWNRFVSLTIMFPLVSRSFPLSQEVRGFYEEQYAQESRFHTLKAHMLINAVQLKRSNDETTAYMSKDKATKSSRWD